MRNLKFVLLVMAAILLLSGVAFSATTTLSPVPPPQMVPYVLEGVISAIVPETGAITLVFPNMPQRLPEGFFVNNLTRILKNGQIAPFSALAIGDWCRAEIKPTTQNVPLAVNVQAKTPPVAPPPGAMVLEGIITQINADGHSITLSPPPGAPARPPVTFLVNDATKIMKNGQPAQFSALAVGDKCRAEVVQREGVWVALNVQAGSAAPPPPPLTWARGKITVIAPAALTFTLLVTNAENPNGVARLFFEDRETKIRRNGIAVGFGDLKVGDFAEVGFVLPPTATTNRLRAAVIEAKSAL
ncbi:MAG: DUF5666 domain-containing protein [Armatimonadetes bacterium]|nr:DUF5666 domain-containing protein [Armatimonadota bacterium]